VNYQSFSTFEKQMLTCCRYDETLSWDDKDNVSPYLNLSDPEKSIAGLRDPLEIVIRLPKIQIEFDYPLEKPVRFDYDADTTDGFTRFFLL